MRLKSLIACFLAAAFASACASSLYCAVAQPNVESHKTPTISGGNPRILVAANAAVGKKMWSGFGLPNGKLGCAAALSNVLKQAGYPVARSAAVVVVRNQLLKSKCGVTEIAVKHSKEQGLDLKKLKDVSRPGDLIFGYMTLPNNPNYGPDAHCGVVAGGDDVFANDWNDGIWKRAEAEAFFGFYPHVYVMRIAEK